MIYIIETNKEVPSKSQDDGDSGRQEEKNVWEQRYYEILQQHELLCQEFNEVTNDIEAKKKNKVSQDDTLKNEKISELENALNSLHIEYKEL